MSASSPHNPSATGEVTLLLREWQAGDSEALDQLVPLVYDELRRLADRYLRGESKAQTLQPTALVHEAYMRLVDLDLQWQGRVHFFGVAAGVMRRILVDVARARGRVKRGGGQRPLSLSGFDISTAAPPDLTEVDEALGDLENHDPRKARVVEMRYFAGLTNAEIAQVLDLSVQSIERDLRLARAWLSHRLRPSTP
ncbi:MAG: sigma-70 family RNA polymerase sigma factor [Acidobacteriota bacterium]